jgi:hypothetical protein
MLDQAVAQHVNNGWTVESRTDTQAVLTKKKRIGWMWNIIFTILTGGLWAIVVFFKLVNRKVERKVITVDGAGNLVR